MPTPRLYNLIAELTYRCPLRCAYCSNPLGFRDRPDALDAEAWVRAFREAADLGALHVGLTGGEPTLRSDLREIASGAARAGLYVHLVTAGTTLDRDGLDELATAGVASVQLSIQDSDGAASDEVAGVACFDRKLAFAREVKERGLFLTLNFVLHRRNIGRVPEIVALARKLGADRVELANTQYHGWALLNRRSLLPSRAAIESAADAVAAARRSGGPEILFVLPDYHADRPKPCMGGWGRRMAVVAPDGRVLPCHGAAELPDLEFWSLRERSLSECWADAPGMNAYRGEDWMREPCRTCPERERDFGGCRCQAHALAGDATVTDPACSLAPRHDLVQRARRESESDPDDSQLVYRGDPSATRA